MINEYPDTYFLSGDEALRIASQQNRSKNQEVLQVCYYDGKKIESEYVNLIHMPLDDLLKELAQGRYRLPTEIDFTGLDLSSSIKVDVRTNFESSLYQVREYRNQYNKYYSDNLKNSTLNFDEKLRFYLVGFSQTQVMQYVSKNIASTLESLGYEVLYDLFHGIEDMNCSKIVNEFNPHVTININHFNNGYINDLCFNFVWFQDLMPILHNNEKIHVRDRDFIFTYSSFYTDILIKKNVDKNKIFAQHTIGVDTNTFYLNTNITKEEKIIFVGSAYTPVADNSYINEDMNRDLTQLLEDGLSLNKENIKGVFKRNALEYPDHAGNLDYIQQSYIRNTCVSWLCKNEHLTVELYGHRWENSEDKDIIKHFKGTVDKDSLNELYNGAKYILSASGGVINTQRLGEIVHAGAIPVIYDSRDITDETETWEEECLFFKTQEELNYILDNQIQPKKYMSEEMLKHFTYDDFINTMLEQINKKIN